MENFTLLIIVNLLQWLHNFFITTYYVYVEYAKKICVIEASDNNLIDSFT